MARRSKQGRFEVWNQGSDGFKHTDLAYNWDQLDQMLGSPSALPTHGQGDDFNNPTTTAPTGTSQWLYPQDSTQISNLGNRTMYNIVRALDYNSVQLGSVIAWWRPSIAVPLPSGCVPADGCSYTGDTEHSYGAWGITTITVPDLRNKMILGVYETAQTKPPVALNRDNTAAVSTNTATDGPGIGAVGGSNVPLSLAHTHGPGSYAAISHTHAITEHTHSIQNHYHGMEHIHGTNFPTGQFLGHFSAAGSLVQTFYVDAAIGGGGQHVHTTGGISPSGFWHANTDGSGRTDFATNGGGTQPFSEGMASPGQATGSASPVISGSSASALTTSEILPRYVGLLYVVKIRKPGPLHNTSFPVGT